MYARRGETEAVRIQQSGERLGVFAAIGSKGSDLARHDGAKIVEIAPGARRNRFSLGYLVTLAQRTTAL